MKGFNPVEDRYKIEGLIAIFSIVITILLPFGIMTLNRLIHRNIITDKYIIDLEYIRKYFKDNANTEIKKYFPFQDFDITRTRKIRWYDLLILRNGGLVETVTLMNSIIAGVAASGWIIYVKLLLFQNYNNLFVIEFIPYIVVMFTVFFLSAWFLQFYQIKIEYRNASKKIKNGLIKREGVMPYEKEDTLVICSKTTDIDNLELMNVFKNWRIINSRFYLKNEGQIFIHDMYFDTEDKKFSEEKNIISDKRN